MLNVVITNPLIEHLMSTKGVEFYS